MAFHWEEELKELCPTGCPHAQGTFMRPIELSGDVPGSHPPESVSYYCLTTVKFKLIASCAK